MHAVGVDGRAVQGQCVGSGIKLHLAVTQDIILVGFGCLLAAHPHGVGDLGRRLLKDHVDLQFPCARREVVRHGGARLLPRLIASGDTVAEFDGFQLKARVGGGGDGDGLAPGHLCLVRSGRAAHRGDQVAVLVPRGNDDLNGEFRDLPGDDDGVGGGVFAVQYSGSAAQVPGGASRRLLNDQRVTHNDL